MSWANTVALNCANRAAVYAEIFTRIAAMGWTLHDDQSGSSYKVYKSAGEASDRITEYVKIDWITANTITITAYNYWNASTHVGTCGNSNSVTLTTSETGCYVWIYGDLNVVFIATKVSSTYYGAGFGHFQRFYTTPLATLQAQATNGSSVTIQVDSTSGFIAGNSYQIVGAAGEGRDRVVVSSITDSTHMVISSLPRTYGANSKIGINTSTFMAMTSARLGYPTCSPDFSSTTNSNTSASAVLPLNASYEAPDVLVGAYVLMPFMYQDSGSNYGVLAYLDTKILASPTTGMTAEDTFGVNVNSSGTSSGSNDATHMNDTGKSWSTNAFAGKFLIITAGTGAGQTRQIASNSGTQIVVTTAFSSTPDGTSTYVVVDEAYRYMYIGSTGHALLEVV